MSTHCRWPQPWPHFTELHAHLLRGHTVVFLTLFALLRTLCFHSNLPLLKFPYLIKVQNFDEFSWTILQSAQLTCWIFCLADIYLPVSHPCHRPLADISASARPLYLAGRRLLVTWQFGQRRRTDGQTVQSPSAMPMGGRQGAGCDRPSSDGIQSLKKREEMQTFVTRVGNWDSVSPQYRRDTAALSTKFRDDGKRVDFGYFSLFSVQNTSWKGVFRTGAVRNIKCIVFVDGCACRFSAKKV